MTRTALLVSGSRNWTNYRAIYARIEQYPAGTILIHGDCGRKLLDENGQEKVFPSGPLAGQCILIGADWICAQLGSRYGLILHAYPYFRDLGKLGGPKRNECMLAALLNLQDFGFDCCFEAFPMGGPGTAGMIRLVEKHNISFAPDKQIPVTVTAG